MKTTILINKKMQANIAKWTNNIAKFDIELNIEELSAIEHIANKTLSTFINMFDLNNEELEVIIVFNKITYKYNVKWHFEYKYYVSLVIE